MVERQIIWVPPFCVYKFLLAWAVVKYYSTEIVELKRSQSLHAGLNLYGVVYVLLELELNDQLVH